VNDLPIHRFQGRDGIELAYREIGVGRPALLLHGYLSNSTVNWLRYGHAQLLAEHGHRVIMPDLRAHGDSAKPRDRTAYPHDILADDGFALLEALGLTDYDLGGYSLGARAVIRMLVRGAKPRRAIVAGMGFEGVVQTEERNAFFRRVLTGLGTFERNSPEGRAEAFLQTVGGDPIALLNLLDSSVDTSPEELARIELPVLVVMGSEDREHGSAERLARVFGNGCSVAIVGNHMTAVSNPKLGTTIAGFLD
jgi:pimeloyl-ACP methyl ester carboxylesterase